MKPADHAPDFRGLETPVALVDGTKMAANIAACSRAWTRSASPSART